MNQEHASGVNYKDLDLTKVSAAQVAATTSGFIAGSGWKFLDWTRGESACAMMDEDTGLVIGSTIEGLGTKNLVAEDVALRTQIGRTFYDSIGRCLVGAVVNDLLTLGLRPLNFMIHPALAEGNFLKGEQGADLNRGVAAAMEECGCTWGSGETPELKGIIAPGTTCLSGAAIGFAKNERALYNPANIRADMRIVILGSSGIHANGLTKVRQIASTLPNGYLTSLPDGRTFGEAVLTPTTLYAKFMRSCRASAIPIAYSVNVTGHGFAKFMRAPQPWTYRLSKVPPVDPLFLFIQEQLHYSQRFMYGAYNMGAGFVLMVSGAYLDELQQIGQRLGISVLDAGCIEEGPRQVIVEPIGETYTELDIR